MSTNNVVVNRDLLNLAENDDRLDKTKLHHNMDIIHGYEFIKSAERRKQNRIVGFNIKTYANSTAPLWASGSTCSRTCSTLTTPATQSRDHRQNFNLDFSSIMMNNSNDTTHTHFQVRASQGSFKDWVESRIGRFTPREYWDIYRIDTEAAKDNVQEKIDEGDKAYELILKNLKLD